MGEETTEFVQPPKEETKGRVTTTPAPKARTDGEDQGHRANRRATRRGAAYQRPRRKPNFQAVEVETPEEANAGAQSEAQPSDSADARADDGVETDTQGFEKPQTLGSFD